ncbi:MAG: RNA polymerase sporulation sigma factor SigK [Clostridia bacterium]|nr:RNA polymerase sporulation sigma factor SigK [Clostridia bacterium]MBO4539924.1 RNA polymerase sporulation sigma factor SigK [Clostridia bacterium]
MKSIINKVKQFFLSLRSRENEVDYIVSLPSPLDPCEEAKYVALAEQGDENARNELIEHNLRLVVYIAKRFDNTGIDMEELISIGSVGLIKAVKNYKSGKNIKLATFASRCIENEILMYLRKMVKIKTEVSLDEPLNVDREGNQLVLSDVLGTDGEMIYKDIEARVENEILIAVYNKLSDRDKSIVGMRYGLFGMQERTQKEIADMMNISQSYISRLEKRILTKMKEEIIRYE